MHTHSVEMRKPAWSGPRVRSLAALLFAVALVLGLGLPERAIAQPTVVLVNTPLEPSQATVLLFGASTPVYDLFPLNSLPLTHRLSAANAGDTAEMTVDLSNAGFDFSMEEAGDSGALNGVVVSFSVDQPVRYELSGSYGVVDGASRGVVYDVTLESSAGETLFLGYQEGERTANEQFVLGGLDGDVNRLEGAPTGTLLPGVTYKLEFSVGGISNSGNAPTTATGSVTLRILDQPVLALLSPAEGEMILEPPVLRWSPGPYEFFLVYVELALPGGARFPFPWILRDTEVQLPPFFWNAVDPRGVNTWLVLGFDFGTGQSEVTPLGSFQKGDDLRAVGSWDIVEIFGCDPYSFPPYYGELEVSADHGATIWGSLAGTWRMAGDTFILDLDDNGLSYQARISEDTNELGPGYVFFSSGGDLTGCWGGARVLP